MVVVSAINKLYGRCRWQLGLSDALVVMSAIHKLCGSRRWQKGPSNALLQRIAASTEGFAGADLQALCTAAVMAAVTRAAPTLVDHLCNTPEEQEQRQPSQQQQPGKQQQQQQGDSEQPQDQFDGRCNKMQHQGQEVRQQGEQLLLKLPDKLPQKLLEKLQVAALDWRAALAAAPLPCSARQNLSALSSGHARALPHNLVPLLLPALTRALRRIATAQLPWQAPMQCALESAQEAAGAAAMEVPVQADEGPDAAAGLQRRGGMVNVLSGLGAIQAHPSYQTGAAKHRTHNCICNIPVLLHYICYSQGWLKLSRNGSGVCMGSLHDLCCCQSRIPTGDTVRAVPSCPLRKTYPQGTNG